MKKIFVLALAALGFASCQMLETEPVVAEAMGQLQLNVSVPNSIPTRATDVNVDNFEVLISGPNNYEASYTVSNLPSVLTLPVGQYTVTANTPGEMEKTMDHPYFEGTASMQIQEGITTQSEVNCKQRNVSLKMNYADEFLSAYNAWVITVEDGNNSILTFDQTDTNPAAIYWNLGDNVSVLTINVEATPKTEGSNVVKGRMTVTKADAEEGAYEGDSEHYVGGDAIKINITQNTEEQPSQPSNPDEPVGPSQPSEPSDPSQPSDPSNPDQPSEPSAPSTTTLGLGVTAQLTFDNTDETVTIPVVWETDDIPVPQPTPGDDNSEPAIVFTAPSVTATTEGGPALDATISVPNGLKSILVQAESDGDFQKVMEDLEKDGLTLLSGHELVGDILLPALFEGLGISVTMPSVGDTDYIFNIANFYQFLGIYGPGTTVFSIIVTDNAGKTNSGSVTVTITK